MLVYLDYKELSSSTSHEKLRLYVWLYGNIRKILSSTFIYEPILIEIYGNANIMNTQISDFIKYDLKGH